MRKLVLALLLAALGLAVAGCGGRDGKPAAEGEETVATGQVPFDRAFIDAMVPHHQSAIGMAREAKQAGLAEPDLLEIANNIIATQQAEIDQMLDWRSEWFGSSTREAEETALEALGLTASEAGMEHHGMDLSTADDVDQTFAEMMVAHHEGAIRMAELAKQRAGRDEIKTLAGQIIAAQRREIDVMEKHAGGMHE